MADTTAGTTVPQTSTLWAHIKAKATEEARAFVATAEADVLNKDSRIVLEGEAAEWATKLAAFVAPFNPAMASAFTSAAGLATKAADIEKATGL